MISSGLVFRIAFSHISMPSIRATCTTVFRLCDSITLITEAGEAQSVEHLTTDWKSIIRSPAEAEDFASSLCVQTGSGAHPASCTMGTGGPFPGDKARPGRDADHSPSSSAEVVNE
jgi:hypothetical protein